MKAVFTKLISLFFVIILFSDFGISQDIPSDELRFEVNRIYPYIFITKDELKSAKTIVDLNTDVDPAWIREYISVEIVASHNGKAKKALNDNGDLNQAQKDIMNTADQGTNISAKVRYIPENTLVNNDIKEINFTFTVNPDKDAKYTGGQQQLNKYLKEKAIDKIPVGSFEGYDLTAVKFTVGVEGEVIDAHVSVASGNEEIDNFLLATIRDMPCWEPAEYSNGLKVKQDFLLTVGNMENCMIYTFKIHPNGLDETN